MLLKLLRFQTGTGAGRPTRATLVELRYRALASPRHPCRSSHARPASSQRPQVDRRSEALPAPGQHRRKHTFEPVLLSGHSADDEGNESSPCPKHGQCVSAFQRPVATRVAGLYAWNQLGRHVKKGERGIRILAPMIGSRRKPDADAGRDGRTHKQPVLVGFRSVYVFDVAQTEGKELPEIASKVTGNAGEYRERLMDFTIGQGIQIEFKESIAPALGMSYGGKIALLPGQGSAEEFSTLVHELAHEMLHKAERRTATTKTVRETEAEAVAFVVGTTIGLNNGRASADYIHLYNGNAALLAESLEVIQRTAAVILSALKNDTKETAEEPEIEPGPALAKAS